MSTGTVMPVPILQFFDSNGDPLALGKLYVYAAGTLTPATTYTDSTLATPNANPIILNSAGRPASGGNVVGVYLDLASYKFVLKTSADVTVWTLDNVQSTAVAANQSSLNDINDFRLTLTTATPVTSSDVTAATTIYMTPAGVGNRIALYDGTATWTVYSSAELSLALGSDAANTNYDVFAYNNNGVVALERLAWTSSTARATGLALQDGIYVKSGATTRRYLGTYRTTGTIGQTEDSLLNRYVWNYYHRTRRPVRVTESTSTWTYTTATWRQARATASNQVNVLVGVAVVSVCLRVVGQYSNTNAGAVAAMSIGEDGTTAPATGALHTEPTVPVVDAAVSLVAALDKMPAVGLHTYSWLEYSQALGTGTFYGASGNVRITGLSGWIEG